MKSPKLIDLLTAEGGFHPKHDLHHIRPRLMLAKKFTFDESASRFMGELLRRYGKEILSNHEWAKPPYPDTWVEIDHHAYYVDGLALQDSDPATADQKFGALFSNGHAYPCHVALNGRGKLGIPSTTYWSYAMHQPASFEHELKMAQFFGTSRMMYCECLLGGVAHVSDPWWTSHGKEIARSHRMEISPPLLAGMRDRMRVESRARMLSSHAGDLKIILAMLLLLTRPHRNMVIREEGPKRMLHAGKRMVMRPSSIVTMHLAYDDPVKRYIDHLPTGITREDHNIKGHWCESRIIGRDCPVKVATGFHDWQPIDPIHYKCDVCDAKKWWHKAHLVAAPDTEYDVKK
jgi:hypothetical protein